MARQIVIRDDLYEALSSLKGGRSFSQVIEELLKRGGHREPPMLQVLQSQNRLLSQILGELKALNRRLASMQIEVKEVKSVKVGSDVAGVTGENLPSYLRGNPWVEILQGRTQE